MDLDWTGSFQLNPFHTLMGISSAETRAAEEGDRRGSYPQTKSWIDKSFCPPWAQKTGELGMPNPSREISGGRSPEIRMFQYLFLTRTYLLLDVRQLSVVGGGPKSKVIMWCLPFCTIMPYALSRNLRLCSTHVHCTMHNIRNHASSKSTRWTVSVYQISRHSLKVSRK